MEPKPPASDLSKINFSALVVLLLERLIQYLVDLKTTGR